MDLIELFLELETLAKLLVMIGIATPILILDSYLHPWKKPKDKTKKYKVEVKGMKGEVLVND